MTIDHITHKNILLQILKEIYSDTSLGPYLGFKGGTAAHLFYGLNRDSVDLDFDLLDESKKEFVFEKIQTIAARYGRVIESQIKRFNILLIISYEQKSQNIKIEINRRDFGSQYKLQTLLGISMLVMTREDMFAHKLMAMKERMEKTSRDIYDTWFFLKDNWPINKGIVEHRSGLSFKETLQKCIEQLEKMDNKHILVGLGELLGESQKDWARAKLRDDTIFLLKVRVESEKD
jgi:predicted nucleotidyltransferase component of viral defense system